MLTSHKPFLSNLLFRIIWCKGIILSVKKEIGIDLKDCLAVLNWKKMMKVNKTSINGYHRSCSHELLYGFKISYVSN